MLLRARIVFRDGHSVIDAVVLDLSAGGARLRIPDGVNVPARFELRIDNRPPRQVEIRFRAGGMAGVRFLGAG